MFRTCAIRGTLIKSSLKKTVRNNVIRNFGIECIKRKPYRSSLLLRDDKHQQQWFSPSVNFLRHYSSYPPHQRVALPALSPTMDSGTIISWAKKEGDKLNEGDVLAEIETDKATMAFETPEEGYLAKILIPAGTKDIPVGKLVCIIVEKQEDVDKFKDFKDDGAAAPAAAPAAEAPKAAKEAPPPTPAPAAPTPAPAAPTPPPAAPSQPPSPPAAAQPTGLSERVKASPMARRLAEVHNIRLQGKGSGLYGSITTADVQASAAAGPGAAPAPSAAIAKPRPPPGQSHLDIPLTGMRKTIAKRLVQAKQMAPHYYLSVDVNVDNLVRTRAVANKSLEKQKIRLSYNDFVIKAVAVACQRVPEVNSAWMDTFIRQYSNVDVSVAVSTDKGLITPIVFNAGEKTVTDISLEMKELAAKARANKLKPQEFQGGTVSISNIGMYDITSMFSIINPPHAAILGVGTMNKRLVLDKNSSKGFKESDFMTISLSGDHRVIDGAMGAAWLKEVRNCLEEPGTMVV